MISSLRANRGLSLIEVVIYVALFVIVLVTIVLFYLGIFRSSLAVRAEHAAVQNVALAARAIELEVRHADFVYTSTSIFDSDAGQLSLRTPRNAPSDHDAAYVDFYLDNGVVYEKWDDGMNPLTLTSADVSVSTLRFERKTSGSDEGVRIILTASPLNVPMELREPRTIRSFVALRPFSP